MKKEDISREVIKGLYTLVKDIRERKTSSPRKKSSKGQQMHTAFDDAGLEEKVSFIREALPGISVDDIASVFKVEVSFVNEVLEIRKMKKEKGGVGNVIRDLLKSTGDM